MSVVALPPQTLSRSRSHAGPPWFVAALLFLLSILLAPRTMVGAEPPAARDSLADLDTLQQAFQKVAERVAPSVVGIRVQRRHVLSPAGSDSADSAAVLEQRVVVNGSGSIVSPDGLILTNEHVIQAADDIRVLLYDGTDLPADVLMADPRSDFAVLKVSRTGLVPVRMGDWSTVARGQWSVVVGNPFGLGSDGHLSVAVGVVSNLGRQLPGLGETDDRFYNDMLQTTAPINPGHSGGPLFNIHGELIGVVTAMHTRTPADEGVGFAIPMTPAKRRIIDTLCQGRPIEYGYLGVIARQPTAEERRTLGLAAGQGIIVQVVDPEGPATQAGVAAGDTVREFDHQAVTGPSQFAELVGQTPIGTRVSLVVLRDGQPLPTEVAVGRRDVGRVASLRAKDRAVSP